MKNKYLSIMFCLMFVLKLHGNIQDHLKIAENKSDAHQISNFYLYD